MSEEVHPPSSGSVASGNQTGTFPRPAPRVPRSRARSEPKPLGTGLAVTGRANSVPNTEQPQPVPRRRRIASNDSQNSTDSDTFETTAQSPSAHPLSQRKTSIASESITEEDLYSDNSGVHSNAPPGSLVGKKTSLENDIRRLALRVGELQLEKTSVSDGVAKMKREKETLAEEIARLQSSVASLRSEETRLSQLHRLREQERGATSQREQEIARREHALAEREENLSLREEHFESQKRDQDFQLHERQSQLQALEDQLHMRKKDLDHREFDLTNFTSSSSEEMAQLADRQVELRQREEQLQSQEQHLRQLEYELRAREHQLQEVKWQQEQQLQRQWGQLQKQEALWQQRWLDLQQRETDLERRLLEQQRQTQTQTMMGFPVGGGGVRPVLEGGVPGGGVGRGIPQVVPPFNDFGSSTGGPRITTNTLAPQQQGGFSAYNDLGSTTGGPRVTTSTVTPQPLPPGGLPATSSPTHLSSGIGHGATGYIPLSGTTSTAKKPTVNIDEELAAVMSNDKMLLDADEEYARQVQEQLRREEMERTEAEQQPQQHSPSVDTDFEVALRLQQEALNLTHTTDLGGDITKMLQERLSIDMDKKAQEKKDFELAQSLLAAEREQNNLGSTTPLNDLNA